MPDIGLPPQPPPDVMAQMQGVPGGGVGGPGAALGQMGASMPGMGADITPKVLQAEPLLMQIARLVPSLAPDTDRLLGEMKARMTGAMMNGLAGLAGMLGLGGAPMGGPPMGGMPGSMMPPNPMAPAPMAGGGGPPPGMGAGMPPPAPNMGGMPLDPGMGSSFPPPGPAGPPALPPIPQERGLMDVAMDLEVLLPSIGADDGTLLPDIQYFVARMRDEVPKVISGDTDDQYAALSKHTGVPTDASLRSLPVMA